MNRKPIPTRRVLEAVLWILNAGAQWHINYGQRQRIIRNACVRADASLTSL